MRALVTVGVRAPRHYVEVQRNEVEVPDDLSGHIALGVDLAKLTSVSSDISLNTVEIRVEFERPT